MMGWPGELPRVGRSRPARRCDPERIPCVSPCPINISFALGRKKNHQEWICSRFTGCAMFIGRPYENPGLVYFPLYIYIYLSMSFFQGLFGRSPSPPIFIGASVRSPFSTPPTATRTDRRTDRTAPHPRTSRHPWPLMGKQQHGKGPPRTSGVILFCISRIQGYLSGED